MVCGRCWLVIKIQTFSFVCLTIPELIMPFNWKSVSLCIFLLVSVILFYPEEQVFFHICSKYAKEREEYIFHAMNMKLPVIVIMIMPHTKNICPFTNTQKTDKRRYSVYTHHTFPLYKYESRIPIKLLFIVLWVVFWLPKINLDMVMRSTKDTWPYIN